MIRISKTFEVRENNGSFKVLIPEKCGDVYTDPMTIEMIREHRVLICDFGSTGENIDYVISMFEAGLNYLKERKEHLNRRNR